MVFADADDDGRNHDDFFRFRWFVGLVVELVLSMSVGDCVVCLYGGVSVCGEVG